MGDEGRLTSGEGAKPCVESVTVKEISSKVDMNKDGSSCRGFGAEAGQGRLRSPRAGQG